MRIEVWSDVICPWCAIGRQNLREALRQTDIAAEVELRAFELDPGRTASVPVPEMLRGKYGAQADGMLLHVEQIAHNAGMAWRIQHSIAANTFDAHRLILSAQALGRGEAMLDALVAAHFEDGLDISLHDVLIGCATACGMDSSVLRGNAFKDEVRQDEQLARQFGIHGVPFFLIDRRIAVSGAQPVPAFVQAIQSAAARSS